MSTVPVELKPISAFVARANELSTADPVISYWCSYYAVKAAMTLQAKSPESSQFLLSLMDKLEIVREELKSNEAVSDDGVAAAYVDNFSSKIFDQADAEDRSGRSTRLTAKKFLAAANFLELLSLFNEATTEVSDKIKYSKWKASDIAKAFRDGRKPVPGPVGGIPAEEDAGREVTDEEAEKALSAELLSLDPEPDDPIRPLTPSAPPPEPEQDEPAATPDFPSFLNTPTTLTDLSTLPPSTPFIPPSHQTSTLPPPPTTPSAAFPTAVFPPPVPKLPSPPTQSYFPPVVPTPPTPIAPVTAVPLPPLPLAVPTSTTESLDPSVVAKIQKHAKWAISALNYDDLDTARKELRSALALLG